jgi:hypothetical protein
MREMFFALQIFRKSFFNAIIIIELGRRRKEDNNYESVKKLSQSVAVSFPLTRPIYCR